MAKRNNVFFKFLFQAEDPSHSQYQTVLEDIITVPSLTEVNEERQQELILNLNSVATRLKPLLRDSELIQTNKEIADKIILNILRPILSSTTLEFADPQVVTGILLSSLVVVPSCSGRAQKLLLEALAEADGLLERMITDPKDSKVLTDWVDKISYTHRDSSLLQSITQRLMTLCDRCTLPHGTSTLSERWQDLLKITGHLKQQESDYQHNQTRKYDGARDTRHLDSFRLLEADDKKTGQGQPNLSTSYPQVPAEITDCLAQFGIPIPNSQRTRESALDRLQTDETLGLLRCVMKTFPCRPCNESACNSGVLKEHFADNVRSAKLTDHSFDPEILGPRIGVWKVLLSAQAVRDTKNVSNSGTSAIM